MAREKYYFEDKSSPLIGRTEREIDRIIHLYESGEKIAKIKTDFPFLKPQTLNEQLPFVESDETCEVCNSKIYKRNNRKGNRHSLTFEIETICTNCGHIPFPWCDCNHCQEQRKREIAERKSRFQSTLQDYIDDRFNVIHDANQLDIYKFIYLREIFLKFSEEINGILNFKIQANELHGIDQSMDKYERAELLKEAKKLIDQQYLRPSLESPENVIKFIEGDAYLNIKDDFDFLWELNLHWDGGQISNDFFSDYCVPFDYSPESRAELWKHIYREHIFKYISYYSEQIGIEIRRIPSDCIADELVEDYSLSKGFSLIYSALKSALQYKNAYQADKVKTESNFRNTMFRYSKQFLNSSTLMGFDCPKFIKPTVFDRHVFSYLLMIKGDYFYKTLKEIIPEYEPTNEI